MLRTYKYRLYPTEQAQAMSDILQAGCWLYNAALHFRRERWQESRHSVTYYEQAAMWRDWRNEEPDDNPLRMLNMTAGQQVLRRLDGAFREFFQEKRGCPRFKKWHRFNSVNYKPGDGSRIKGRKLYVQNVGLITVQSLAKLRRLQRKVARRKKGSKRRRKAIRQLAKQQEHIANQRRDWWHKVTRKLVDTYGAIVLEDLNLNFMLQNGNLARSAHDVSLGMFRELLDYKAMEAGVEIVARAR